METQYTWKLKYFIIGSIINVLLYLVMDCQLIYMKISEIAILRVQLSHYYPTLTRSFVE